MAASPAHALRHLLGVCQTWAFLRLYALICASMPLHLYVLGAPSLCLSGSSNAHVLIRTQFFASLGPPFCPSIHPCERVSRTLWWFQPQHTFLCNISAALCMQPSSCFLVCNPVPLVVYSMLWTFSGLGIRNHLVCLPVYLGFPLRVDHAFHVVLCMLSSTSPQVLGRWQSRRCQC